MVSTTNTDVLVYKVGFLNLNANRAVKLSTVRNSPLTALSNPHLRKKKLKKPLLKSNKNNPENQIRKTHTKETTTKNKKTEKQRNWGPRACPMPAEPGRSATCLEARRALNPKAL